MMTLPASPNRLWQLSFWLVVSSCIGLILAALLWIVVSLPWAGLGLIAGLLLGGAGLLRPRKLSIPYKFWNGLAKKFAHFGQVWVAGVCFYTVFAAVGRTGASLSLARPGSGTKSLWTPRETQAPSTYIYSQKKMFKGSTQRGWVSSFGSWAAESRNLWAVCLLPFLLLLKALDTEQESEFPSDIYTLY